MSDMSNIMTRLFTVIMLLMFSMRICYYGEFATNRIRSLSAPAFGSYKENM